MQVDSVIHARWIIPVEPESTVYENFSLVVNEGKIVDLLPTELARQQYQGDAEHNLTEHALIPGLINCHTHAAMTLLRGIADDLPLMEWLEKHIWPLEKKWMDTEFVKVGTDLAIAEMLRSGTTCFNDMYFFPQVTAQQAITHGIRACLGLVMIEFPSAWADNATEYLDKGLALHECLREQPLITTAFAPHAPYTVSDASFKTILAHAQRLQLPIHTHLHESAHEIVQQQAQSGQTPLQRLHDLGVLNSRCIAVHMTQLTDADIAQVAKIGVHIVHCPESNLKLASGFHPLAKCLAAGINVALGTDGAASNDDLDMLGEMRTAALLAKGVANDASAVSAMTVLKMATLNGAKALGLEQVCGSLEIGKAADVVAIDLDCLNTLPLYQPIAQIVYSGSRQQVTDVWVAGKQLVKQRQLLTFDETVLKMQVRQWQQRLVEQV